MLDALSKDLLFELVSSPFLATAMDGSIDCLSVRLQYLLVEQSVSAANTPVDLRNLVDHDEVSHVFRVDSKRN
jgi:hypothetical protein